MELQRDENIYLQVHSIKEPYLCHHSLAVKVIFSAFREK